jgi:hypothetical protein
MFKKMALTIILFTITLNLNAQLFKQGYFPSTKVFCLYGLAYGDFTTTNQDFLKTELEKIGIKNNRWVAANSFGFHFSYLNKNLYTSASFSTFSTTDNSDDSLTLNINHHTLEATIGYNLLIHRKCFISIYSGLKYNRIRNNIDEKKDEITLEKYLQNRDFDLRIGQLSLATGFHFSYVYKDQYTIGFYVAYLHKLHKNAWISSENNSISHNFGSPFKNINIGLGMGYYLGNL